MTPVEFHFVTPAGLALASTEVEIQLTKSGFDAEESGVVMPRLVTAVTDAQGKVTVPLWPNAAMYVVSVIDPVSEAGLSYKFYVPEVTEGLTVRMQDIVVQGPMSDTEWDTVAIQQILDAKASAISAWNGAVAAQEAAELAAEAVGDFAGVSEAYAAAALVSQNAAAASATGALASETAAAGSRDAALVSKNAAAASATAASTSAAAALASENTATAEAAAALASQLSANASEEAATLLVPHYGPTPQADPVPNATWINSDSGRRYTYLNDGSSSQWVETGAVVAVGSDTIVAAQASATAAAASADEAEAAAALTGFVGASVDGSFNLIITRADSTNYNAGYVRGPQGAAFTVDAVGPNLAGRDAYDSQPDEFSYLDTGAGNLYFRVGATPGVWSAAIPFGKGEQGDPGTTDFNALDNKPVLGTASPLNVAASGNAAASEVVKGNDTRLTDARTPVAHTHTISNISDATATGAALLSAASAAAARSTLVLDQVNNTSDASKPVSTAQAAADALKVAKAGDTLSGALNFAPVVSVASAATVDLAALMSNTISVTGTVTVASLGTLPDGARRLLNFTGILTLTHNATSLILPHGESIVTDVGDVAEFVSLGSGNWRCVNYTKARAFATSMRSNTLVNRIMNGDFITDQRNAGGISSSGYVLDRWYLSTSTGNITAQRSAGTPPPGTSHNFALALGVAGTFTPSSSQIVSLQHAIEGYDVADMLFGTSSARTFTLGFWVHASATGTYAVSLCNHDGSRSYVAEYTINSASTWEYKTITVPGDTSGSWDITTSIGLYVRFGLSIGSTFQTSTLNAWQGGNYLGSTTQNNFLSASPRTMYITGLQLERGAVATPFEYLGAWESLWRCQRFYQAFGLAYQVQHNSDVANRTFAEMMRFIRTMRATPTLAASWTSLGNATSGGFGITNNYAIGYLVASGAGGVAGNINWSSASAELI